MNSTRPKILVVSASSELKRRVRKLLPSKRFEVSWTQEIDQLVQHFKADTYDVVILTSSVCREDQANCIQLLDTITTKSPITQILLLAEPADIHLAMSALEVGTYQYTKLPVSDKELRLLIETACARRPQFGTNLLLQKNKREDRFEGFMGGSPQMQKVYQQILQAANTDIHVLLLGETGTGKDLAAQAIHRHSARKHGPYLPVNLGALPAELIASELFGHAKGAFTGAHKEHKGKFEQAEDGTVFLDEIDAIDEKVQVSLLRLIEHKKAQRLGSEQSFRCNARLIVASNQDLEALVRAGAFREDLFFRLDVFRIVMPNLRQRKEDIPLLVREFLARYVQSFGKNILEISSECLQVLNDYDWPGNVRELKNVIQRAVLVCEGEEVLPKHLPSKFRSESASRPTITFEIGTSLEEVERKMIVRTLALADNNRKKAAELLGISRRAIYNRLKKHNLK